MTDNTNRIYFDAPLRCALCITSRESVSLTSYVWNQRDNDDDEDARMITFGTATAASFPPHWEFLYVSAPPPLSLSVIYAFVHRLFHIKYKLGNLRFIDTTDPSRRQSRKARFFTISNERLAIETDSID